MKLFREVNWSEVVRKAIEEYIRRLEEGEKIVPAEALMEEIMRMGVSPSDLEPMSGETEEHLYRSLREKKWRRVESTIQA